MRKVIVLEHISLDGVIQARGDRKKIQATASRMAGGQRHMMTTSLGGPEKAEEHAVRPAVRTQDF